MRKLLLALMALGSLPAFVSTPARAQNAAGRAEEPTAEQNVTPLVNERAADGSAPQRPSAAKPFLVSENETLPNVYVRDQDVIVAGHVQNDVLAVHGNVTVLPSARIGGSVVALGGQVINRAGAAVRAISQNGNGLRALFPPQRAFSSASSYQSGLVAGPKPVYPNPALTPPSGAVAGAPAKADQWFGAQFALLALGLLGGALLLMAAPRATRQVAAMVSMQPGPCLILGALATAFLLVVELVNALLIKSPIGLLWSPIGLLVGVIPLLALIFGWLIGMRLVGDLVARKLPRLDRGESVYARMALGLIVIFLAKLALGLLGLGGVALAAEFAVALAGLGAVVITGCGTDPDWLRMRLRGETGWLTREP